MKNTLTVGWAAINREPQTLPVRVYAWACRDANRTTAYLAVAIMAACAAGVTLANMGAM